MKEEIKRTTKHLNNTNKISVQNYVYKYYSGLITVHSASIGTHVFFLYYCNLFHLNQGKEPMSMKVHQQPRENE